MTIGDYITRVRQRIDDNQEPYRFSDITIAESLQEGVRRARQIRPSLSYADGRYIKASDDVNFTTLDISAQVRTEFDGYSEGLVFLAAARLLSMDTSDTANIELAEKWRGEGLSILAI